MNINLSEFSIKKAKRLLLNGDISARELSEFYAEEIGVKNKKLNVYLETFDDSYEQAKESDEIIKGGRTPRELEGIPIALKDNILVGGKVSSAASVMLEGYKASYTSFVAQKLRGAGAVILGRTNMDEFAMGSSTENSAFGPTKNPYDELRVPGGSSGGSAAAVSSNMALAALGSDTGGSIRQPAGFCGIVGMKPTYGAVSRSGLIAMASSLDQIGPITKTVEDAETIFNVIKGHDRKDATSVKEPKYKELTAGHKLKIGIVSELLKNESVDSDVWHKVEQATEVFRGLGHEVKEVSLPNAEYALPAYYIIAPAEISSNMARYDGVRYGVRHKGKDFIDEYFKTKTAGFGSEVKRRIMLGTYVLSAGHYDAYYGRASKVRNLIKRSFENIFKEVDVLITPTSPNPAFKIGERSDPLSMYLEDVFLVSANLAGIPAMSVPFGKVDRDGTALPIGIQLRASWWGEKMLFEAGKILEQNR